MANASDCALELNKLEDLTSVKEVVNGENDAYRWVDITYRNGWVLRVSIYKNVFMVDHPYDLMLTDGHGNLVPGVLNAEVGHWGPQTEGKIEGTDLDTVSYCVASIAIHQDRKKKKRIDPLIPALLGFIGFAISLHQNWLHFGIACFLTLVASLFLSYRRQ